MNEIPFQTLKIGNVNITEYSTYIHPDDFTPIKRIVLEFDLDNEQLNLFEVFKKIEQIKHNHDSKMNKIINDICN